MWRETRHKTTKRCTTPHSFLAPLRVTQGWVLLRHPPPPPPLSTADEWSAPPGFPLEGGATGFSSPASGSHLAMALAKTYRFFRLWCPRCPCPAGRKPSNGQKVRGRGREGDGGVVHSHSNKLYFLREPHWKCPSPLSTEAWKPPVSLEAVTLGYSVGIRLVGFLCNELKGSYLFHFESFLPSPTPAFIFIALEEEGS